MLTHQILGTSRELGVKKVITAAAYVLSPGEERKPVVGAGSSPESVEWLRENGVEVLKGGIIVGMNGLLPCLSPLLGMEGVCLLGTTKGGLADPEATKNILQVLSKMLDLEIDLRGIEERYSLPLFLPLEPSEEEKYIR
jgi:proteasome assembly chaperone (PAC2) family protein